MASPAFKERVVKSKPPPIKEMVGIIKSLTRELTMAVKAEPTTTPTARSMTLPRLIKVINSWLKLRPLVRSFLRLLGFSSAVIFGPPRSY